MTGTLSEKQIIWLRGLQLADGLLLMSATELGDPAVSELQSLGLVHIIQAMDGYNWRISKAGQERIARAPAE